MSKRKIYVVGGDVEYANWVEMIPTNDMRKADVVMFTGGEDVHPVFYKEKVGNQTGTNIIRDAEEIREFIKALSLGKGMIGICRGAQFLTVLNGGRLMQDITGHTGSHCINTNNNKTFTVSSTHHQMCIPDNTNHKLIGWSSVNKSKHYMNGENIKTDYKGKENEIIYYPDTNCLAIQSHPEYLDAFSFFNIYLRNLVSTLLFKEEGKEKEQEEVEGKVKPMNIEELAVAINLGKDED